MRSSGGDEDETASGSMKDTDREVRKSQEPQSLLPMEFVTRMVQDLFDQGLKYEITLGRHKSQEDSRAESLGQDGNRGVTWKIL